MERPPVEEQFASATAQDFAVQALAATGIGRHMQEERQRDEQAEAWRDEVASRIESYKQKRARKKLSGEFSMRFDFGAPSYSPRAAQAAAAAAALAPVVEPEPEPELPPAIPAQPDIAHAEALVESDSVWAPVWEEPEPEPEPEPVAMPANVIEFPRLPFLYTPSPDELAEPVFDRPRILDVPEEVPNGRLPFSDIQLEPGEDVAAAGEIEVPLQVAPVAMRVAASAVDWAVVLAASAVFMAIVWKMATGLALSKLMLGAAVAAPCLFWAMYQFLFLAYCGTTPGMNALALSVRTFDGDAPAGGLRKWRALSMALSCMPLGLGFAWALADEDTLCWHDRITRTYVTRK